MSINLRACSKNPKEYMDITNHNLKEIDNIQNDVIINNLVSAISDVSKIDYQICLVDIKSHLMNCCSYYPNQLGIKFKNILLYLRFFISNLFYSFKPKRPKQVDIMIDDWTEGIVFPFYGEEMINRINKSYKYDIVRFSRIRIVKVIHLLQLLFGFTRCMFLAEKVIKKHKIDLRGYVFVFFSEYLSGLAICEVYKPKLIITGHQNGFSTIKAKAAGAEIVLIPNGVFGYFGDTAFKYADYFISIGGKYFIEAAYKFGCFFKKVYPFGSLRVHNFIKKTKHRSFILKHDLLWVGCGVNLLGEWEYEDGFYAVEAEHKAIRLINEYALKNGIKVAYHCRYDDDVEKLKKLGLFSENIKYLPPTYSEKSKETKNIYEAVKESEIVMCSLSGVCHEALALGKKIAFVNMSGNAYLNYPYINAGVEYGSSKKKGFVEFVDEIKNKDINTDDYVIQNPNYVEDLVAIVNMAVKHE